MEKNNSELLWIFFVTAMLLFFSYWPIVQNFGATPADRYYYGQEEYPIDMLGDLAYVQQGYQGKLLASFNYGTMIGGHPSIVKIEYILVGLVGRVLNVSAPRMFFISRFVISLGLLAIIYFIIRRIFAERWKRIVSYIFVLFGAGITIPGVPNTFETGSAYDMQVFTRLTQAMQHYLLGAGTVLLALYFLSRALERPKRTAAFVLSLFFGVAASLLYAPNIVLLLSGFPLYIVFDSTSTYLRTKRVRVDWVKVGILFAYSAVTIAPIVYVHYITTYVWSDIRTAWLEQLNPFRVTLIEYMMGVGVLYLLSFLSLPSIIRKGKPLILLLVTWLIMHPVGEFIISPILHLNYVRYFLTPYYVAFGILATISLTTLVEWIHTYLERISKGIIAAALVVLLLSTSIGTYTAVWQGEHLCFCLGQFSDFAYPKRTVMDGIFWLHANTSPNDIILSAYHTGMLISAFAGNRPYVTWWYRLIEPPTIQNTEANLTAFYNGDMPDAYTFLKRANIAYVFYSEEEESLSIGGKTLSYPFLRQRYNKDGVVVYQVQ